MTSLHPWNIEPARRLLLNVDRLAHGMLLAGPRGLGKAEFSLWVAQWLLCSAPKEFEACGHCQNCTLFHAGTHPDIHVVQPEAVYKTEPGLLSRYALRYPPEDKSAGAKDSTVIRIDQIRALIHSSQTRPQIAGRKVMILAPADALNTNAANSLLKLLEEPPADSVLLLISDLPERLMATIRSRCTRIDFSVPPEAIASAWLASKGLAQSDVGLALNLAAGAPLEALRLVQTGFVATRRELVSDLESLSKGEGDPVACATRWKGAGSDQCLAWMQSWVADIAIFGLGAGPESLRNRDLAGRLQGTEKRLDLKKLFRFSDLLASNRQKLGGPLDEQLLLEDTLIRWTELHAK